LSRHPVGVILPPGVWNMGKLHIFLAAVAVFILLGIIVILSGNPYVLGSGRVAQAVPKSWLRFLGPRSHPTE
jgi:hypothetical protein